MTYREQSYIVSLVLPAVMHLLVFQEVAHLPLRLLLAARGYRLLKP
jgi:hypothetical protein